MPGKIEGKRCIERLAGFSEKKKENGKRRQSKVQKRIKSKVQEKGGTKKRKEKQSTK